MIVYIVAILVGHRYLETLMRRTWTHLQLLAVVVTRACFCTGTKAALTDFLSRLRQRSTD